MLAQLRLNIHKVRPGDRRHRKSGVRGHRHRQESFHPQGIASSSDRRGIHLFRLQYLTAHGTDDGQSKANFLMALTKLNYALE
jgi:hypothetical protein